MRVRREAQIDRPPELVQNAVVRFPIWDFDGTLGYRVGRWSSALFAVLEQANPSQAFETHTPRPVVGALSPVFIRAFEAGGAAPGDSHAPAARVRNVYVDPGQWRLFDDAVPALRDLSSRGWTHLILSNHVPELPGILNALGIGDRILRVFNSAESGYEKPHPRAFDEVLGMVAGAEAAWMVGDNVEADVRGAEAVGLSAILVRGARRGARHHCEDLSGISAIVGQA